MENHPFQWVSPLGMVILHSYIQLPEDKIPWNHIKPPFSHGFLMVFLGYSRWILPFNVMRPPPGEMIFKALAPIKASLIGANCWLWLWWTPFLWLVSVWYVYIYIYMCMYILYVYIYIYTHTVYYFLWIIPSIPSMLPYLALVIYWTRNVKKFNEKYE